MSRARLGTLLAGGLIVGSAAVVTSTVPAGAHAACLPALTPGALTFAELGRYATNPPAGSVQTAAEIVAYEGNRLYVMNIGTVDVVDISNPAAPLRVAQLPLPGEPTSVAVKDGLVAVSIPAALKTDPGRVLFFRGTSQVGDVTVGSLPDMVTFTPDGNLLAVANEGEPNSYGLPDSVDPEGSVSVIHTQPFRNNGALKRDDNPQPVETISFAAFNVGGPRAAEVAGVRITGPDASVAQDLEPEYITVADDDRTAWVSLQENNAVAQINLRDKTVTSINALGYADHSRPGFGFDASDRPGVVNIANYPVKGMYMPDGIANYSVAGRRFVVTANEGDARDWPGISSNGEEARRARSVADLTMFPDAADDNRLGRLNVTPLAPATTNAAGKLTSLYSFGSRSFSIRTADGELVWDSGDQFETITAATFPANFNASNSNNTFRNRSDDKGPEPENVALGAICGRTLAFVALERIGGVMIYDVTNPRAPKFLQYLTTRDFSSATVGPDSGPEGLAFIAASKSPTGKPMLAVGNEVSGTVNLFGIR